VCTSPPPLPPTYPPIHPSPQPIPDPPQTPGRSGLHSHTVVACARAGSDVRKIHTVASGEAAIFAFRIKKADEHALVIVVIRGLAELGEAREVGKERLQRRHGSVWNSKAAYVHASEPCAACC
jgi:hypothetical protein